MTGRAEPTAGEPPAAGLAGPADPTEAEPDDDEDPAEAEPDDEELNDDESGDELNDDESGDELNDDEPGDEPNDDESGDEPNDDEPDDGDPNKEASPDTGPLEPAPAGPELGWNSDGSRGCGTDPLRESEPVRAPSAAPGTRCG